MPFSPHELIEKLAALVPPPRVHLIRDHGVLAPHATDRAQIVFGPRTTEGVALPIAHRKTPAPARLAVSKSQLRPAEPRPHHNPALPLPL